MITSQVLYHLTIRAKSGGPLEDRTPTSAVQRRRAPIITSSPEILFINHIETHSILLLLPSVQESTQTFG